MKSRTRITIAQSQRLSLNGSLAASLQVLRDDAAGLTRFLEEQGVENPALILGPPPAADWLPRWTGAILPQSGGDPAETNIESAGPSLAAHVIAAIAALRLPPPEQRIADRLVLALEPSGWLGEPLDRVASQAAAPLAEVEAVLRRLQRLEPTGIFARDLEECLRLQSEEQGHLDAAMDGILSRLPMVAQGDLDRLSQAVGRPVVEIAQAIRRLRGYDPKPGAQFQAGAAPLRAPDLTARRGAAGWEIALNRSALPTLSVAGPGSAGDRAEARALIRLVEGRNATLLRVAREILSRQQAMLEAGPGAMVPMTMQEVADALDLHQTTVSRVVAGAAVDTPRGTFWLRTMFSVAVRKDGPAGAALRDVLARMVASEDPAAPLSDAALARELAGAGAPIARRTVAKYREMIGIPPAHARRRRPHR